MVVILCLIINVNEILTLNGYENISYLHFFSNQYKGELYKNYCIKIEWLIHFYLQDNLQYFVIQHLKCTKYKHTYYYMYFRYFLDALRRLINIKEPLN